MAARAPVRRRCADLRRIWPAQISDPQRAGESQAADRAARLSVADRLLRAPGCRQGEFRPPAPGARDGVRRSIMAAPKSLNIRTYSVGFGDCFLLSFAYANGSEKHVLIDFGSMAGAGGGRM